MDPHSFAGNIFDLPQLLDVACVLGPEIRALEGENPVR